MRKEMLPHWKGLRVLMCLEGKDILSFRKPKCVLVSLLLMVFMNVKELRTESNLTDFL